MNPSDTHDHGAEASPLGQSVVYRDSYAPELLFPIARQIKRDELGLAPDTLPFVGEDLWNAYELSWLNSRGKPVAAIGTFRVPVSSPRLIESKSLKLYLNSFNQHRFVDPTLVHDTLTRDLSGAAGAPVAVSIEILSRRPTRVFGYPHGVLLDEIDIEIDTYQTDPAFLQTDFSADEVSETLYSHLLKSNCLVTGQPDWGTVVVRYIGPPIDRAGLLRYIVSFRSHNEFHEQCVERIFCDVLRRCAPRHLAVWARYTRRGGLDINPFRSTGHFTQFDNVAEVRQ
ncbi:NADPH-dependent 7-cyano-7-deazaguanine reductase QueF [Aromatoleum buckelii]|uniref:NADPH-dependent 7-cyano-7-deazaguanine reductase n=1 Tax=Aromatoleum buckelii TaxID=200254 RepID=A0ABX1N3J2_9RHOO|nr:NADPH-dependent 7-cyano-7-deazaguanine reductase QueF [Aromatoleum buckelii]MCK0511794.1 NADPH-dependent 7-cyano-7-deazaguanine reductase QueF [Aromatoleum buckelii]